MNPVCGRYPAQRLCGCTIPCRIAMKEVTLDAVRPQLFIGPVQAAYLVGDEEHKDKNITHVINASNSDYTPRDGIQYLNLPVDDESSEDMLEAFKVSIKFIAAAHSLGGAVLVHCHAGKSRSAAICAAFLMFSEGLSDNDAIDSVRTAHPRADPNIGFRQQLNEGKFL